MGESVVKLLKLQTDCSAYFNKSIIQHMHVLINAVYTSFTLNLIFFLNS